MIRLHRHARSRQSNNFLDAGYEGREAARFDRTRLPGSRWSVRILLFEGSDELGGLRNPAELSLYGKQGRFMIDSGQTWLGRAIGQQETGIIPKHRVAQGGLNTDAGGASCENQAPDGAPFKNAVEIGFKEAAVAVLVNDDIVGYGR